MGERQYYSSRTGINPRGKRLDLQSLKRLFISVNNDFDNRGYYQEVFGYHCVDRGDVPGKAGYDIEAYMLRKVHKPDLWPITYKYEDYTEDDLFDVIEFLYDHISKPMPKNGDYHSWGECGWHYKAFDKKAGQDELRAEVNLLLQDYEDGYELSQQGEILSLAEPGMESLLEEQLPEYDPRNIDVKVMNAVRKFRLYRSSIDDKREALRVLVDVLEYLRPKFKQTLTRNDESDLFNIANNFGIRHHNERQKTEYDQSIWLDWMFYFYLATIHAVIRRIKKEEEGDN